MDLQTFLMTCTCEQRAFILDFLRPNLSSPRIPWEIHYEIMKYLDLLEVIHITSTCKSLRKMQTHSWFWRMAVRAMESINVINVRSITGSEQDDLQRCKKLHKQDKKARNCDEWHVVPVAFDSVEEFADGLAFIKESRLTVCIFSYSGFIEMDTDQVSCLECTSNFIILGHFNGSVSVYVYDHDDLVLLAHMLGHTHTVLSLAYSAGRLFSGGKDGYLIEWNWKEDGSIKRSIHIPDGGRIRSMAIIDSCLGDLLVAIMDDGTIKTFNEDLIEIARINYPLPLKSVSILNYLLAICCGNVLQVYSLAGLAKYGSTCKYLVEIHLTVPSFEIWLGERYLIVKHLDYTTIHLLQDVLKGNLNRGGILQREGRLLPRKSRFYLAGNPKMAGYYETEIKAA
jgi:hypothetical protein